MIETERIQVLIADDQAPFRRGLRALLMGWGASARAVDTATRQLASASSGAGAEPPRTGAAS